MKAAVDIVLVGIGGYGQVYLSALLDEPARFPFRIAGAVDPEPQGCALFDRLKSLEIPVYSTLEEFYGELSAGLAVISSPIQHHSDQTVEALGHGSHVLCEKPAAATVQEVDRMMEARDEAGRFVAVGYQWSFTTTILTLKREILAGRFGAPKRMKSLCLWPRDDAYYNRNHWAGRMRDDQGRWVLDSPANNAMAHDIHNMLFLLGDKPDRSAEPAEVRAELFRANEIETFDTAALQIFLKNGVEVMFYGSHAIPSSHGPQFEFEFEHATILCSGDRMPVEICFEDGTIKPYTHPNLEINWKKLWVCLEAVGQGKEISCGLEAARPQVLCINGAQESMPETVEFPDRLIRVTEKHGSRLTWVEGLAEALTRAYDQWAMPSESNMKGAIPGASIDLRNYAFFPRT
ncbi:MAG: Gfo/Idh/MocA family protein [Planctomycetota bacterium]|jgi:predicted dehydrogenase